MTSVVAPTTADVYRKLFAETTPSSEVFAAGLGNEPVAALVEALAEIDGPLTVHLLVSEDVLKWFRRDFHLASTAADLIDAGTLAMRVSDDTVANAIVATEDAVVSIVTPDGRAAGLMTDDDEFVAAMREQCSAAWEAAAAADLRTPPRSHVYETLADELGSDLEADYRAMLDAVGTTRSGYGNTDDDDELDEIELAVLAGAKREVQLYHLSRWGERMGLASKATFSRAKTRVEDQGLIDTEKVKVEVGRPRLRLVLDDRLAGYDAGDLPAAARDELQAPPA